MGQVVSDVGQAVVTVQSPNAWIHRPPGQNFMLPNSIGSAVAVMREGVMMDLLAANAGYNELPDYKKQLVKYSGSALIHGRPMDAVMIVTAGETGKGKSTTIKRFFDNRIYNDDIDRTRWIYEYTKEIRATAESPPIVGKLKFVDFPGAMDEDPDKNVENFARFKLVRRNHPDLADRDPDSEPRLARRGVHVRRQVYPNLLMLVASANDSITTPDSKFRKSAAYVKASGMVDTKYPNLIIVVTRAMEFDQFFGMKCDGMREQIQRVIFEIFKLQSVPVVFIENKYELYRGDVHEDFYILPNGEKNYGNLKEAMEQIFEEHDDNLARQFISHYFHPNCPEKQNEAFRTNKPFFEINPSAADIVEARNELQALGIYGGVQPTLVKTNFCYLGKGFCPKTERAKSSNVFSNDNLPSKVVKILGDKSIRIPQIISVALKSETASERLGFTCKEDYEKHRKHKYGLSVGIPLVVSGNLDACWKSDGATNTSKELMKFAYYIYFAKLELLNPETVINQRLRNEINSLPTTTENNSEKFELFFERHGTHLIKSLHIGGSILIEGQIEKSAFASMDKFTFEGNVEKTFKAKINCALNGQSGDSSSANMMSQLSFFNVHFHGGQAPHDVTTVKDMTGEKLLAWINSVKQLDTVTEIPESIELEPYYIMCDSDAKKLAAKEATIAYLKKEINEKKSANTDTRKNMSEEHARAGRRQAEEQASSGGCCFTGDTIVSTTNRGNILIKDLRAGDILYGENGAVSKFYTFLHYEENKVTDFLDIYLEDGAKLQVTPDHLIFCNYANEDCIPILASAIRPGHTLIRWSSAEEVFQKVEVKSIGLSRLTGVYCPLVQNGTFLANSVLVSCYASVNSHSLAHMSMTPLRMWHFLRQYVLWANQDTSPGNGIHIYARTLMKIRETWHYFYIYVKNNL